MEPSHYRQEMEKLFEYLQGYLKKLNKKGISDDERTEVSFFFSFFFFVRSLRGEEKKKNPLLPSSQLHTLPQLHLNSLYKVFLSKTYPANSDSSFLSLSFFFLRFSKELAATAKNLKQVEMIDQVENWVKLNIF